MHGGEDTARLSSLAVFANLVAVEFDDREMRGDAERSQQLDGGVRGVDAGHSYIPSFLCSASLPSQSSAQNLHTDKDVIKLCLLVMVTERTH